MHTLKGFTLISTTIIVLVAIQLIIFSMCALSEVYAGNNMNQGSQMHGAAQSSRGQANFSNVTKVNVPFNNSSFSHNTFTPQMSQFAGSLSPVPQFNAAS